VQIELWDISRPKPYEGNPRKLPEKAIKKVAASIKEFGFRSPIVVDEQEVILAGHTRLEGAKFLGLKKVPVHIATGLTEAQCRAYRIADTRVAQETDWLDDPLMDELTALNSAGFDLGLTGFDDEELKRIMGDVDFDAVDISAQGRLDEKAKVECPECGHEFEA
jgi:ParB-like chromosome segregation protein Spo0J